MLELNNTRHAAFQHKDTKDLDYGCHSHTSTAIEYINMQINFANGIIPMKSERNWDFIQDIESTFVYKEEQGDPTLQEIWE